MRVWGIVDWSLRVRCKNAENAFLGGLGDAGSPRCRDVESPGRLLGAGQECVTTGE